MLPAMMAAAPMAQAALRQLKKKKGGSGVRKTVSGQYRRRRRARLTQGELMELNQIKNILGKTAAANALPFYLGRGR
jgi:hypothetical protein